MLTFGEYARQHSVFVFEALSHLLLVHIVLRSNLIYVHTLSNRSRHHLILIAHARDLLARLSVLHWLRLHHLRMEATRLLAWPLRGLRHIDRLAHASSHCHLHLLLFFAHAEFVALGSLMLRRVTLIVGRLRFVTAS